MQVPTKTLVTAAAIAVTAFAILYFPDREDGSGAIIGGLSALIAAALGLTALTPLRPLPKRARTEHVRLGALALALGAGFGAANFGVNYGMAALDPSIQQQMVTRWARFSPLSIVIQGPIMEELVFRLGLLSGLAWLSARFTSDRRTNFHVALGVSAVIFGIGHIFYGGVAGPMYQSGMAVKSSAAGLLLGWVFWRWGLPYSILCHCMANAVHLVLMPLFF